MQKFFLICFENTTKAVDIIQANSENEAIQKFASNRNGNLHEENGILYYKLPKSNYRLYALNNNHVR